MPDYTPTPGLLRDRVILITGAGDGIGRAVALDCAAHGATVVLLGRTTHKLEAVYDDIVGSGHPQPAIYPMNLEGAAPRDYDDLATVLDKEFGRLDGLLHNAAWLGTLSPIGHFDIETWFKSIQVNLNAPFLLTRACLPLMQASEDASLVFTSDQVTQQAKAYWGAYGVAKYGINGLMRMLAEELSNSPVRVNGVIPGPVRTNLRTWAYPGEDPDALPAPESITGVYLYLLGPDSKGRNGGLLNAQDADLDIHCKKGQP